MNSKTVKNGLRLVTLCISADKIDARYDRAAGVIRYTVDAGTVNSADCMERMAVSFMGFDEAAIACLEEKLSAKPTVPKTVASARKQPARTGQLSWMRDDVTLRLNRKGNIPVAPAGDNGGSMHWRVWEVLTTIMDNKQCTVNLAAARAALLCRLDITHHELAKILSSFAKRKRPCLQYIIERQLPEKGMPVDDVTERVWKD